MFRAAARSVRPAVRGFSTAAPKAGENAFIANREATRAHAAETTDLWRKISFYVCIPGVIVGALWTYKIEAAHAEHLAHHPEDFSERPVYDYLNIRNKNFPWGRQSAFFNPAVNVEVGEP
ncbi:hypothetical protein B9479_003391 [Cryptococcus floricola]|uniref:Cytochrome c oxidase subunit 6A, mitochondrial n=1 Tax=Cryptococcus floricola TaxID=2591691 RepID=A0A5D3AYK4_9TREE|nr:hypothetical protein B9479_003391 [Cryptococcus floricola]